MVLVHIGLPLLHITIVTTTGIIQVIPTGVDVAAIIHTVIITTLTIPHTMEEEVVEEDIMAAAEDIIQVMVTTMEDMMTTIMAQE